MSVMKRYLLASIFICTMAFTSFAQLSPEVTSDVIKPDLKVTHVNFSIGLDWDKYNSMSLNQLMAFAQNPEEMQRDLSFMTEEVNTTTAGLALYYSMSFSPLNKKTGSYYNDREWRFGFAFHSPKEAMVTYQNEDLDTSIVYCNLHSEFSMEGSYIVKGMFGKRFQWYVGGGLNLGYTFGNQMMLISGKYFGPDQHPSTQESYEHNIETYDAKSVMYSRAFVPYGFQYRVGKHVSLGIDCRSGVGLQWIKGERVNLIRKTGVFSLGMRYILD